MQTIDVHELKDRTDRPLIDVREAWEYEAVRVPGAINLPMSTLGGRLDELPAEGFDVICKSGVRSGQAVEVLEARGYDAANVEGGTDDWVAAGYPTEDGLR
ncbi:rhodanese-like domain-containing protein [Microbacterium sp. NPDC055910]|uniref:rhodanese-like domain-containing protein n=1 Tax=Microbacterium sp. NPDC055910 TaxID=3345659 RepID=UPI0035D9BF88